MTDEMVEAAAKAICARRRANDQLAWESAPEYIRDDFRADARAALTAASAHTGERMARIEARLRKEAARAVGDDGSECCCAPTWTCCDPKVLVEAADMLAAYRSAPRERGPTKSTVPQVDVREWVAEVSAPRAPEGVASDLVARLRASTDSGPNLHAEAADRVEADAARIERLEVALREIIQEDQVAQYNGTAFIGYADGSRARIARTALGD